MKGLLKTNALNILLLLVLSVASVKPMYAIIKPRWVTDGTKELNKQRSNTSYEFVALNSHDLDINWLKDNKFLPLKKHIVERFNAIGPSIEVYPSNQGQDQQYKVIYKGQDGKDYVVEAKLIDEFEYFDDYELNVYEYEYYQLYAISMPNTTPLFDKFKLTEVNSGMSNSLALIPGAAQIYKGKKTEGLLIIGGEAILFGFGAYFEIQRHDCHKKYVNNEFPKDSWRSKERSWQAFEMGAFASAGALYIYSLIDGIKSKSPRQVKVKKNNYRYHYSLMPYIDVDHTGMSLVVNF